VPGSNGRPPACKARAAAAVYCNPIESALATVRLRQRVTKGPDSRAAGIAMAFKLIESAQHRWRAINSAHLVALIRAGAKFEKDVLVERPDESTSGDTHAA
jgi:putative transposase